MEPLVTIIIPNWNGLKWLPSCLEALNEQTFPDFQTIVVDNGSTDQSIPWIKNNHPNITTIQLSRNHGFAYAVNQGIAHTQSPYICLLNNDTVPEPQWLENLVNALDKADRTIGGIGSMMLSLDDPSFIDDAGNTLSWYLAASKLGHGHKLRLYQANTDVFSISAGASLFRKTFFEKCGSFDEDFFAYLEDIDLCLRGNLYGFTFLICPSAIVLHKSHGSEIPKKTYVKLVTANRLALLLKNIPLHAALQNLLKIIYGQLYFFIAYGKPISSFKGYYNFFCRFTSILKTRKIILRDKKLPNSDIIYLLSSDPLNPPLSHFIKGYLKGIKNLFIFR